MAYVLNGTSQYLSVASAPATAAPITIVAFARPTSGAADCVLMQIGQASTNNRFVLYISSGRASGAQINDASSSTARATTDTTANGAWRHCGAVFTSALIEPFHNGASGGTLIHSRVPSGVDRLAIGARTTNDLFVPGEVAEAAIWTAALTVAEMESLAAGFKPFRVRPQSLVFYAPLIRAAQDLRGGLALTENNGPTVANNPRVYG